MVMTITKVIILTRILILIMVISVVSIRTITTTETTNKRHICCGCDGVRGSSSLAVVGFATVVIVRVVVAMMIIMTPCQVRFYSGSCCSMQFCYCDLPFCHF